MFTKPDKLKQFLHYACTSTLPTILNQRQDTLQHLPVNFRCAAVLMPVDWNHGNAQIWLTQRSQQLRQHRVQIAFPGGKLENNESSINAAFRESEEETGLIRNQWQLVGTLPQCYLPSGFKVVPVLAWSNSSLYWQLNPSEVSEIFPVPLPVVLDSKLYQHSIKQHQQLKLKIYHLHYQNRHIWGATASMLLHLAQCYQVWSRQNHQH